MYSSLSLSLFLLLTSIGVNEIWRGSIVEEGDQEGRHADGERRRKKDAEGERAV